VLDKQINPFKTDNLLNINKSRVLREIWLSDGISRIEIAKKLNLDKSTITKIVNQLISNDFIITTTIGNTGPLGGRKPISLSINNKKGCFLGVELQTEKCIALLINLHGDIIADYESLYESENLESVIKSIRFLMEKINFGSPLIAVGVGVSGIINHNHGIILKSFPLHIANEFNLRERIVSFVDCPVIIENDANCGCWGEFVSSKTNRTDNMLYLTGELDRKKSIGGSEIGAGIGLGIFINGKVLHGTGFSAGEFRSVLLEEKQKNQFQAEDVSSIIDELARNMAMIINTFNITEFILGGTLYKYGEELLDIMAKKTNLNWAYEGHANCHIRFSKNREKDVAYGAAGMCLEQFFSI